MSERLEIAKYKQEGEGFFGISADDLAAFCIDIEHTPINPSELEAFNACTKTMTPEQRRILLTALDLIPKPDEAVYRRRICKVGMDLARLQLCIRSRQKFNDELNALIGPTQPTLFDPAGY